MNEIKLEKKLKIKIEYVNDKFEDFEDAIKENPFLL